MIYFALRHIILTTVLFLFLPGCRPRSTPEPSTEKIPARLPVQESVVDKDWIIDLILTEKSTIRFQEQAIHKKYLSQIFRTITPYVSLSKWRLVVVQEESNRIRVLEAMEDRFRDLGRDRLAEIMERWKPAPLLLVFCLPKTVDAFGGVPPEMVRSLALVELGMGVQSLALAARAYGVETHWIAGALLVNREIKEALDVSEEYDVVFFGVAGYPSEEIIQKFPALREVCYAEGWGKPFR
ncbi:MAG: nitroreductase family protein [bacterium]